MSEFGRFFIINAFALGIDALSSALVLYYTENIYLAPAVGVGTSFVFAYLAHEFWTFKRESSSLSSKRFLAFTANCTLILLVRFLVISLIEDMIPNDHFWGQATILAVAAGVSFLFNYFISHKFVFTSQ